MHATRQECHYRSTHATLEPGDLIEPGSPPPRIVGWLDRGDKVKVEVTQIIDRPVGTVFGFYAHDHVRNHPRWDPMMELEQITEGTIGVGTVIRRRNTHFDDPVEGTMEVIEFEENHAMGVVIHDGDTETFGRMVCEAVGPDQTRIFVSADMPWMTDPEASDRLATMIQGTADNIKKLIETET